MRPTRDPSEQGPWPWWRWVLTGSSALALALSSYLGWRYLMGGPAIGCDGSGPCDEVLNSRWSSVGGVLPVSGLAAGVYLALLLASFFLGPETEAPVRRLAWRAMLALVGAAAGSALWFTSVQAWIVGDFCPYCMALHLAGLALAVLVIWRAPREGEDATSPIGPVSVGLAMAGVLAVSQFAFTPEPVAHGGDAPDLGLPALDSRTVPLIGSQDAPYVVNLLFDYQCRHCQQLHLLLGEAVRRYDGKLAFALCPAPLSPECNPHIPADTAAFKDSCELARIALAVWVAKREAFAAFDHWMFSAEPDRLWRPRGLDAARAKAVELLGEAKFDAARRDPWVERHLQTSIRIFGGTGAGAVPKLVRGSRWIAPQINRADDLVAILQDSLGVPPPP